MANIIKDLLENKPSISQDEFYGGLALSGLKHDIYFSTRQRLLSEVLAAEEMGPDYKRQFEKAIQLADYGFEREAMKVIDYMLSTATEVYQESMPEVQGYVSRLFGYLEEKKQAVFEAHCTYTKWKRNTRIHIDDCRPTQCGRYIKAVFCTYSRRDDEDADWNVVKIDIESAQRFVLESLSEAIIDKSHPVTGEHIQQSFVVNEEMAGVQLLEYLENYVKLYIESGQPIKIIPTK